MIENQTIETIIEYLDIRKINLEQSKTQVVFLGGLHKDELDPWSIWKKCISPSLAIPRIEVTAHGAADLLGRRDAIEPINQQIFVRLTAADARQLVIVAHGIGLDEITQTPSTIDKVKKKIDRLGEDHLFAVPFQMGLEAVATLYHKQLFDLAEGFFNQIRPVLKRFMNGEQLSRTGPLWYLGRKIDLNRKFPIAQTDKNWEDIFKSVTHSEAQLLIQFLRNHPEIRFVFTNHADNDNGHLDKNHINLQGKRKEDFFTPDGFYMYDTVADARRDNSQQKALVLHLKNELVTELIANDYTIASGPDNPQDPDLGRFCNEGLVYQGNIDERGIRKLDNSFEAAAVELTRLNLAKIERCFCFEIPGGLSYERNVFMQQKIVEKFITPFLAEQGIF